MNILIINDPSPYGGASAALLQLTKELVLLGCSITVCTSRTPELDKKLKAAGAAVISCGHVPALISRSPFALKTLAKIIVFGGERILGKNLLALKKTERAADLSEIDIVHTNSARSDLGCMIARKYHIPHIVHLREYRTGGFSLVSLRHGHIRFLNNSCNCFAAISDAVKNNWIENGIDGRKTVRILDGVDVTSIAPRHQRSCDGLRIIMAGSIEELKGQHICIKAVRMLPENIRGKITLDIFGWENPRYRDYLDKLIEKYGLGEQVRFLGIRDGIGDILCNYDVGVMASRSEGFGLVTAEYMAAGLGVIASDSGANPELVSNGINGLLFNRNDPSELARCILKLFRNRELLDTLGRNGRKSAEQRFSSKRNAEQICELYCKVLRQHRTTHG